MKDREILELAAKAYGFGDPEGNFIWTESEYPIGSKTNGALWNYAGWCDTAQLWNPLNDDGDALRLAVKLNLLYGKTFARSVAENNQDGDDIYAATRLAIVLAAAEIGRLME